jgi:cytoskeletal protein RodZ
LQQLSRTTKISPRVLQVLESSDESRLPARVFTRSFVRSYAVEVGLDPDDIVRRYLEQLEDVPPALPVEPGEPDTHHVAAPSEAPVRPPARVLRGRFGTATVLTIVAVAIVVLAATRDRGAPPAPAAAAAAPQPAVATAGFAPASPAPVTPVGTGGSAPAAIDALHIVIAPTGPCWVQAIAGENRLFGGLLNAGDQRTVDAPSDVSLRVGDPAVFAFTINGKPARIAGVAGQAVTVRITRDNYTQFLKG